jgi:hypothetical protein
MSSSSARSIRRVFVLVNSPVGSEMYIESIFKANPYITKMFDSNKDQFISKRNLERLRVFPIPSGGRFKLLSFDICDDFFAKDTEHVGGPDIFDICHEQYMTRKTDTKQLK